MEFRLRGKSYQILIALSFVCCLLIGFSTPATGDGGVVVTTADIKQEKHVSLPSQKAAVFWDGSQERLILSTKIKGKDLTDLAWITPVPSSKPPIVKEGDAAIFNQTALLLADFEYEYGKSGIGYQPSILHFLFGLGLLLIGLWLWLSKRHPRLGLVLTGLSLLLFYILLSLFMSQAMIGSGGRSKKAKPVEVLKEEKVGIYDILILRATNASDMVNWLQKKDYQVPDRASQVLTKYCNQEDFYFVVNRVSVSDLERKQEIKDKFAKGAAMPLEIKFYPEQPFYPMEMSSLNPGNATINLYLFSKYPYRDQSGLFKLRKIRNVSRTLKELSEADNLAQDTKFSLSRLGSKFKRYPVVSWFQYRGQLERLNNDSRFRFNRKTCYKLRSYVEAHPKEMDLHLYCDFFLHCQEQLDQFKQG